MLKVFFSPDSPRGGAPDREPRNVNSSSEQADATADQRTKFEGEQGDMASGAVLQNEATPPVTRSGRGFAGMDPARQREIASQGGKASHAQGTGHEWTSEEAARAGRKGGQARGANRRNRQSQQQ